MWAKARRSLLHFRVACLNNGQFSVQTATLLPPFNLGQNALFFFGAQYRPVADFIDVAQAADAEARGVVQLANADTGGGDCAINAAKPRLFAAFSARSAPGILVFAHCCLTLAYRKSRSVCLTVTSVVSTVASIRGKRS